MRLNPDQIRARDFAVRRLLAKEPVTEIAGPAGTGKTTLLRSTIDALGLGDFDEENPQAGGVAVVAPTNKAAAVLRSKGVHNAVTLHRATTRLRPVDTAAVAEIEAQIEKAVLADNDTLLVSLNAELDQLLDPKFATKPSAYVGASAIVLDEASMVGTEMAERLLALGPPVLAVGDPFQLPPVNEEGAFLNDLNASGTVLLSKIERQAAGSGILDLATAIRTGKDIPAGKIDEHCSVVDLSQPEKYRLWPQASVELAKSADCIITGTNRNRLIMNRLCRKARFGLTAGDDPAAGEPYISYTTDRFTGIMRNDMVRLDDIQVSPFRKTLRAKVRIPDNPGAAVNAFDSQRVYTGFFRELVSESGWSFSRHSREAGRVVGVELDFAYALTCHRLQGSECDFAVILEDSFVQRMDPDTKRRWLYTAVTRGKRRVVLLRNSPWH